MGKKRYQYDSTAFDVIDSSEKAYWLGFLWGDGTVSKRPDGKGSYVKISLSDKDIDHVYKFKEFMFSTNPVKTYDIKSGFEGDFKEARIVLYGEHLADVLMNKYGVCKGRINFSKIKDSVPNRYHKDLIRGLIDSDGSIVYRIAEYKKSTRKEYSVNLIASESVLDFVNNYLIDNNLTETRYSYSKRHKGRDGEMVNLKITGNFVTAKILEHMYVNSTVHLDRKNDMALSLFSYINDYVREVGYKRNKDGSVEYLDNTKEYIQL